MCKPIRVATEISAFESDSPQKLLAATAAFTRRVRVAQRGTWFPLLVLGVLVAGRALLNRYGRRSGRCSAIVTSSRGAYKFCTAAGSASFFRYWTIGLSLAYVLITAFYVWRARRRGVGTRVGRYAWAWLGGLVLIGASVWAVNNHLNALASTVGGDDPFGAPLGLALPGFAPLLAIGAGLLVLAWVERYAVLAWFAAGYLLIAAFWNLTAWSNHLLFQLVGRTHPSEPFVLRYLVIGGVLLLGSAGFALAERARA